LARICSTVAVHTNGFGSSLFDPQIVLDIADEVIDAVEHTAPDGLVSQVTKPPFHQIKP